MRLAPRINNQKGMTLLVILFLMVITTLLITIMHKNKITVFHSIVKDRQEAYIAEQLFLNCIESAIYEWKTNATANTDHLDTNTISFNLLSGSWNITRQTPTGSEPITLRCESIYQNARKKADFSFTITPKKRMALLTDNLTTNPQIAEKKLAFENLGWTVTEVEANQPTTTLIPILEKNNLTYFSSFILNPFALAVTIADIKSAIATESTATWLALGFIDHAITFYQKTSQGLYQQIPSCSHCLPPGTSVVTTSAQIFNATDISEMYATVIPEIFVDPVNPLDGISAVALPLIEPGVIRPRYALPSAPSFHSRLGVPFVIDDTQPLSAITSDGLLLLQNYLDLAGCGFASNPCCPVIKVYEWNMLKTF